ncbi:MAG TPA: TetR/AcrR family transcriptional regulator [Myxococcota bacterium]|nr:TetR/AcrR family transcriptional regulator [Myxococcota bacterium]
MPPPAARRRQSPLDERLLDVVEELLASRGLEGLSLRRIARRAGVSHGAPLRHYPSLSALLAEVAARGFRMLSEAVDKSAAQLPPGAGPQARLAAAGRGYVELAVAKPGLFSLMFRPEVLDGENERLMSASAEAFELVVRYVRAAQDAGWHSARDTRLLAGCVWSTVHGLATLWADGAFQGATRAPDASLEEVLEINQELIFGDQPGGTR